VKPHIHRKHGVYFIGTAPVVGIQSCGLTLHAAWAEWLELETKIPSFIRDRFYMWRGVVDTTPWLRAEVRGRFLQEGKGVGQ
jgi:hypothetical protein